MFFAVQASTFDTLGSRGVALRIIGLVALAIGAYLLLGFSNWLRKKPVAREAQLATGLYIVLASLAAFVFGGIAHWSSAAWFQDDRMHNASILMFLALTLLFGSMVTLLATQRLGTMRVNLGGLFIPAWIVGAFDALMLCYYWFGDQGTTAQLNASPNGTGAAVLIGISVLLAALGLAGAASTIRANRLLGVFRRAFVVAVVGAIIQTAILAVRAPSTSYSRMHVYGLDIMLVGGVIGVFVFIVAYNRARTARRVDEAFTSALGYAYTGQVGR